MDQPDSRDQRARPRVKDIDWQRVIAEVDALPDGKCAVVTDVDQSMRTHIRKGRFAYIDPSKYDVWTQKRPNSRTRADLFIKRRT